MTTNWTNVPKPGALSWTKQPKPSAYTSVITQVFTGGDPIGLLLALTKTTVQTTSVLTGIWTPVAKPTSNNWTNVPKAT